MTMRDLVAELPEQMRWAAGVAVPPIPSRPEALVVGMGGSGIAGNAAAAVAAASGARVGVHKGYGVPGWVGPARPLVVAVSHSGNTEETLAAVHAALGAGCPVAAVTTGGELTTLAGDRDLPLVQVPAGPQPRAAFGYLAGAVVRVLGAAGILPDRRSEMLDTAGLLEDSLGGSAQQEADGLADALDGRATLIYGATPPASVAANRWKTQINENSKAPAFWSDLPELDHNELVGWTAYPEWSQESVGVVALRDPDGESARMKLRFDVTLDVMRPQVHLAGSVRSQGSGTLPRLFSLVLVGDLLSVTLADRAGIDPMPVEAIESLKRRLSAGQ
jgi:glucose/mannose-6-phosphate isomerase